MQQDLESLNIEKLAAIRHKMMAPLTEDINADWDIWSDDHVHFCWKVVSRAEEIANTLICNQAFKYVFYDDRDSCVHSILEASYTIDNLLNKAKKLIKNLEKFSHNDSDPILVMVFDEASSLLKQNGSKNLNPGRYHALNRILSCLKKLPIWFFFLSTESQVRALVPTADTIRTSDIVNDSSIHKAIPDDPDDPGLTRFPPFLALQLDVENRRRLQDKKSMNSELRKPMCKFTEPKHMAMFGRPLWFAYNEKDMAELAKLKLVGGKQKMKYDATDADHVFAALSFRLSLDVCLQNPRTLPLTRAAVNSFMRVVTSMDHDTGVLDTLTPSEPVLAKAAMAHLCEKDNWSDSI